MLYRWRRSGVIATTAVVCMTLAACQSASKNQGRSSGSTVSDLKIVNSANCPDDATTALADGAAIKVGLSYPLSGPSAANGAVTLGIRAALSKQNAAGGVAGHKIEVISLDDAYDTTRAVSNVTRLTQSDKVMLINQAGTPMALASQPIAEKSCTPQLLLPVSADSFVNPSEHPFTTTASMTTRTESALWAGYIKDKFPNGAKIAVVAYDNDFGKGFVEDLSKQLGNTGLEIVSKQYHPATAVTLDTEAATAVAAKPDVVVGVEGAPFCSKLVSGLSKAGYTGTTIVASNCIGDNYKAITQAANGLVLFQPFKDLTSPDADKDPGIKQFQDDMAKYGEGAPANSLTAVGYSIGTFIVGTLEAAAKRAGGLSRVNVAEAAWFLDMADPLGYEGVTFSADGKQDPRLIKSARELIYNAQTKSFDVGPLLTASN